MATSLIHVEGASALVTGGTRGIGRAIVQCLANYGAKVVFTGTNADAAKETVTQCDDPSAVRFQASDVSKREDAEAAVAVAVEHGGGLDILVNNAGITRDGILMRMSDEDWQRVLDVNLTGTFQMTRAACRRIMKSKRGRMINITSVVGVTGNAGQANYAASKAGIIGFTKATAKELAGRGVTVNAIAPGFIQTDMTAGLPQGAADELMRRIPLARLGAPEDVAQAVAFLASTGAGYITGQVLPVDGGMII